jgi:hypothetical protein
VRNVGGENILQPESSSLRSWCNSLRGSTPNAIPHLLLTTLQPQLPDLPNSSPDLPSRLLYHLLAERRFKYS